MNKRLKSRVPKLVRYCLVILLVTSLLTLLGSYDEPAWGCINFWVNPSTTLQECLNGLIEPQSVPSVRLPKHSDDFLPDERIINDFNSSNLVIIDPEFDQINNRVAWQDNNENLWVAPIDPVTGLFILEEAKTIDSNLAQISSYRDRTGTGNGPEWIYADGESQIVYTKILNKQPVLARTQGSGLELVPEIFPPVEPSTTATVGLAPIGSLDEADDSARLAYLLLTPPGPSILAWRSFNQVSGGTVAENVSSAGRWVKDKSNALTFSLPVAGLNQVFIYAVNKNTLTQITNNPIQKSDPFIWFAPELDESLLLVGETDNPTTLKKVATLAIYQQEGKGWTKIKTLRPPSELAYIRSFEPFTYNGHSYISFLMENSKGEPSEIWIASPDPNIDFYRLISDPTVLVARNDPEVFVAESGVFVYYTAQGGRVNYQAETGL